MPPIEKSKKNFDLEFVNETRLTFSFKNFLESAAFYLLLITIFLAAIPYGTVDLRYKSLLILMICLVAVMRAVTFFLNGSIYFRNLILLFPPLGILILAVIQIIPWTYGSSEISGDSLNTISVDPYSTKNFIIIFSGLIIAFEILLAYTTTQKRLKALICLVLAVGLGSAGFGLVRQLFFENSETGIFSYFTVGKGFAQFINRNHFVYLMEMTMGLLLGLLLKGNLSEKYKFLSWVSIGFLILMSISANSRGGLISLTGIFMIGIVAHFLTINHRTKSENLDEKKGKIAEVFIRKTALALVLACAVFGTVIVTIAFVGGDTVATRIESLQDEVEKVDEQKINRLAIWKSTLELIKEKPLAGVGFGGYSAAITKFDTSNGKMSLQQAHNDYLELLANGGIIAFLFVPVFGYVFVSKAFEQLKSSNYLRRSSCFGAILGIVGVIIHSLVDFGLQSLINALIFMVLIVIATAKISSSERTFKFVA